MVKDLYLNKSFYVDNSNFTAARLAKQKNDFRVNYAVKVYMANNFIRILSQYDLSKKDAFN